MLTPDHPTQEHGLLMAFVASAVAAAVVAFLLPM
jgi:hypothetical protein